MKKLFCSHALSVASVAVLLLAAGCAGTPETTIEEPVKTEPQQEGIVTQVTAEPVKPLPKTEKAVSLNDDLDGGVMQVAERKDLLKLIVNPEGSGSDETALATDIVQRIQGSLGSNDAKIVTNGKFDVRLAIRPKLKIVDRDGDYFRMNCTVDVEMTSANGKTIYGTTRIESAAPRRVLGKDAAIAGLAELAATPTADWCRKELNRIVDTEIGVSLLTIQMPAVEEGKTRDAMKDAANIKTIGDEIAKLPNLVSCELADQDLKTGTCKYRVVYFISKYPNGIANEVSVRLGKLKQN